MVDFENMVLAVKFCTEEGELEVVAEYIAEFVENHQNVLHPWQVDAIVDEIVLARYRIAMNNSGYLH